MKDQIRQEILQKRKALSSQEVIQKSNAIFAQLISFPLYQKAKKILVYIDFRNEVKTSSIIEDALKEEKEVIIPISIPETKGMLLSQILCPEEELALGTYGILEPKKEYLRPVAPSSIDLVLVPGVAFDPMGYRIGYGAGYYDRFFRKQAKKVPAIALAFDLQMVSAVPRDSFDYPVDYIITETKVISCK